MLTNEEIIQALNKQTLRVGFYQDPKTGERRFLKNVCKNTMDSEKAIFITYAGNEECDFILFNPIQEWFDFAGPISWIAENATCTDVFHWFQNATPIPYK